MTSVFVMCNQKINLKVLFINIRAELNKIYDFEAKLGDLFRRQMAYFCQGKTPGRFQRPSGPTTAGRGILSGGYNGNGTNNNNNRYAKRQFYVCGMTDHVIRNCWINRDSALLPG